jgi:hypothetical protein
LIISSKRVSTVGAHSVDDGVYKDAISNEISILFDTFRAKGLPKRVAVASLRRPPSGSRRPFTPIGA